MKISLNNNRSGGFTLIELMIVLAIIALVLSFAIPSYNNYMLDSRRFDGTSFLSEVAGEQERFFSENNRYAKTMAELGYGVDDAAPSKEGYYIISIATSNANQSYTLKATPVVGGPQAKDVECAEMTLNSSKQKTVSGKGTPGDCW